jgi:hypothetical protein
VARQRSLARHALRDRIAKAPWSRAAPAPECGFPADEPAHDWIHESRLTEQLPYRPLPDLDLVEVGCRLLVGSPPRTDREREKIEESVYLDDALDRAGTVYDIVSDVDRDTGEIRRAFMTVQWSHGRLRWERITPERVAKVNLPDASSLRWLIRCLGRELGKRKRGLTSEDHRIIEALYALATSQAGKVA